MVQAVEEGEMIEEVDIIDVRLYRDDLAVLYRDAKEAAIGGKSNVRGGDRKEKLIEDQFTGLMGNYALSIWRDGDNRAYLDMRHMQNKFKYQGDGGYDLPRCRFDVKTSMMRGSNNPLDYTLVVPPDEFKQGWTYGLGLVDRYTMESLKEHPSVMVHLIGWRRSKAFPDAVNDIGMFRGKYTVAARNLKPFTPLVYEQPVAMRKAA